MVDSKLIQKIIEYSGKTKILLEKEKDIAIMVYLLRKDKELKSFEFEYSNNYEKQLLITKLKKILINKRINIVIVSAKGSIIHDDKKIDSIIISGITKTKNITISIPFKFNNDQKVETGKPSIINCPFLTFIDDIWSFKNEKKQI